MSAPRALLAQLIDYAGLFPPAGLPLGATLGNYRSDLASPAAWVLNRLVLPAARLPELETALPGSDESSRRPLRLSVLLGSDFERDLESDLAAVAALPAAIARVEAFETAAASPERIAHLTALLPAGPEVFFELPLEGDLRALAAAVARAGHGAKIRTGSVQAEQIPTPERVLDFLLACRQARLPWKATAGLHHPVRGEFALTYEPASPRATLFGYLNVFLAAVALWSGRPVAEVRAVLVRQSVDDLVLGNDAIRWGGSAFTTDEILAARRDFCRSIGSCSFDEPIQELRALGFDSGATGDTE